MTQKLKKNSRWAEWENAILAQLKNPDGLQKEILQRQSLIDDDDHEKKIVRDIIRQRISIEKLAPDKAHLYIPVQRIKEWLDDTMSRKIELTKIKQYLEWLNIPELKHKRTNHCSGFVWRGQKVPADSKAKRIERLNTVPSDSDDEFDDDIDGENATK